MVLISALGFVGLCLAVVVVLVLLLAGGLVYGAKKRLCSRDYMQETPPRRHLPKPNPSRGSYRGGV